MFTAPKRSSHRALAGVLFFLGLVWAILTGFFFADVISGHVRNMGSIALFAVGFVVWLSWGLIAAGILARASELVAWVGSLSYHITVLVLFSLRVRSPLRFDIFIAIPVWWLVVAAASTTGVVLVLTRDSRESKLQIP